MSYTKSENFYKMIKSSINEFNSKFNKVDMNDNKLKSNYLKWLRKYFEYEKLNGEVIFVNSFYNSINLILKNLMLEKDLLLTYNTCDSKIYELIKENKIRNHLLNINNEFNLEIIYKILQNKIKSNIFLYIEPYNQYPTTLTLSKERIDFLVHLSNQFDNFYVIVNESEQFKQRFDNKRFLPLFEYSKNIISILSYSKKMNKDFNFTSILFKDSDYIKDELIKCVDESDYNLSFIDNILLNEILVNNNFEVILDHNMMENLKKYNDIKLLLDKYDLEYIETNYFGNFWIDLKINLNDEVNKLLFQNINFIKSSNQYYNKNNKFNSNLRLEYNNFLLEDIEKFLSKVSNFIKNKHKLRVSILTEDNDFIINFNNYLSELDEMYLFQKINDLDNIDEMNQVLILHGKNVDYYLEKLIKNKIKFPLVIISQNINNILLKNYSKNNSISVVNSKSNGILLIKNILKEFNSKEWKVELSGNNVLIENSQEKIEIISENKSKDFIFDILVKHIKFIKDKKGLFKDMEEYKLELSLDSILNSSNIKFYSVNKNNYVVCDDFDLNIDMFLNNIINKYKNLNGIIFMNEQNTIFDSKYKWECYNKDKSKSRFNSNALLALGNYIYNKNNNKEGTLHGKNEVIIDYYVTQENKMGIGLPDYNSIKLNEVLINEIKSSISNFEIVEVDEIKLYDLESKHLILELDKLLNDVSSDMINMFGSLILNILSKFNITDVNLNFMFYDHENEIIYNRTFEHGLNEESNCCPTGCVASMIYYLDVYENDPKNMTKNIHFKDNNTIKISLQDNSYFVETNVKEISINDLF